MKAIVVEQTGGPEQLTLVERKAGGIGGHMADVGHGAQRHEHHRGDRRRLEPSRQWLRRKTIVNVQLTAPGWCLPVIALPPGCGNAFAEKRGAW